ncbi:hypothetical protein C1645_835330 [Glomus cerebriforme]|uniref:Uncharacterized protein n=1 Tax=Glomus cerebriforme TaxID=658196 RepID=A0A397SAG2_9GLOM|nr:hypothetical protein C1645_835330 [Glomus cerebriforme]
MLNTIKENNIQYNGNLEFELSTELNNLWSLTEAEFNFIDLIKGLIPKILLGKINNIIKDGKNTREIIYKFREILYLDTYEKIWGPRCEKLKEWKKINHITKKVEKNYLNDQNRKRYVNTNEKIVRDKNYKNLDGLRNKIYFGGNLLGFMRQVNYVLRGVPFVNRILIK